MRLTEAVRKRVIAADFGAGTAKRRRHLSMAARLEYVVGGTIPVGMEVDKLLTRRAAARARVLEAG